MARYEKDVNAYCRRVRRALPCTRKQKAAITRKVRDSIEAFLEETPDADFEQVRGRFGEPETIAMAYIEDMGGKDILRSLQIRRKCFAAVAGALVLALTIWAAFMAYAVIDAQKFNSYEIVSYIEED